MKSNLQNMRRAAGYNSAREFCEKFGYKLGTYTDWEQGRTQLSLERAMILSEQLGCTLDDLAGRRRVNGEFIDIRNLGLFAKKYAILDEQQQAIVDATLDAVIEQQILKEPPIAEAMARR